MPMRARFVHLANCMGKHIYTNSHAPQFMIPMILPQGLNNCTGVNVKVIKKKKSEY